MDTAKVKRIHDLQSQIAYYDLLYHLFKEPVIENTQYDLIKTEYLRLIKAYPIAVDIVPKARSIREQILSKGKTARHDFPMLSLINCNSLHELSRWFDKVEAQEVTLEPNIIGCSVELVYVGGCLHKAVNRGDGLEGKDITISMYGVAGVPQQIADCERINIHGWVTIRNDRLHEVGSAALRTCSPDMLVAKGLMDMFIPDSLVNLECLEFVAHTVNIPGVIFNRVELNAVMRSWGFNTVTQSVVSGKIREVGALEEELETFTEQQLSKDLYKTNGYIFTVNETQRRLELGYTSRYPEYSIHYTQAKAHDSQPKDPSIGS